MSSPQPEIQFMGYAPPINAGNSAENPITEADMDAILGLTVKQIKANHEEALRQYRYDEAAQMEFTQDQKLIDNRLAASHSFIDDTACDAEDDASDAEDAEDVDVDECGNIKNLIDNREIQDTPQQVTSKLTRAQAQAKINEAHEECHRLTFNGLVDDRFNDTVTGLQLLAQKKKLRMLKLRRKQKAKEEKAPKGILATWLKDNIRSSSVSKTLKTLRNKQRREKQLQLLRRKHALFEKNESPEARKIRISAAIATLKQRRKEYLAKRNRYLEKKGE